jgi:hypothetical protein
MKQLISAVFAALVFTEAMETAAAPIQFGGSAAVVSSYVFRGVRQFDGIAFQGTAETQWKSLTAGFWASTCGSESDYAHETDFYLKTELTAGALTTAWGITAYSYDFGRFNETASLEFEISGEAVYKGLSADFFAVPPQNSTREDLAGAFYWAQIGWTCALVSMDWSLGYEFGTYSGRFLEHPREKAVGLFSISASRKIIEPLVFSWNASLPASAALDNQFWMSIVFTF